MYEKEIHEELGKIWDDPDFVPGVLCYLKKDEQRKKILDEVRSGKLNNHVKVFMRVMELAGYAKRRTK